MFREDSQIAAFFFELVSSSAQLCLPVSCRTWPWPSSTCMPTLGTMPDIIDGVQVMLTLASGSSSFELAQTHHAHVS